MLGRRLPPKSKEQTKGLRFIFMLTRDDKTVEEAEQHLKIALAAGVHHIGFKDVGLPFERLKKLNAAINAGGATSYLEVVSLDKESEISSAKAAVEIGVDILLGGTNVDAVLPILAGTNIQYFPFPGEIKGHPSVLVGTIDEVVNSAVGLAERKGVHGLDLLAYRSNENATGLMASRRFSWRARSRAFSKGSAHTMPVRSRRTGCSRAGS